MDSSSRYSVEFRGGDRGEKPWEWCIVDEDEGLFGCAILFDLTVYEARKIADLLNRGVLLWGNGTIK